MVSDGIYLNVYADDTKGQVTDGIFENITNDTIFYASIQNNITIPFKLKGEIAPDENYKLLVSLFLGTNLHESDTRYETAQHILLNISRSISMHCRMIITLKIVKIP